MQQPGSSPTNGSRARFATRDSRMAAWLVLIGAAMVMPGAVWVALAYGVVYVGYPAVRALLRTHGRGEVRASATAVWGALLALGAATFVVMPGGPVMRATAGVAIAAGVLLAAHWAVTRVRR